ncbi:Imm50 family immunity protein [Hymenobacter sp. DG01]|uniref:Imm50 family immunity protein n=1 Tax=Hymenobacter sp. DG01 TaxID=2584940 RepID=UPI001122ED23|nr:Imm50 family immunity protein [Hymenobacter sp. DG01]
MSETESVNLNRIVNSEIVLQHFGYWPEFHDAEITKATFEAHSTGRSSVTFLIDAFEITSEIDEKGYYKLTKHCKIELQFIGIKEMEFDYFSHQNVIFELILEEEKSSIKCTINSSVGLDAVVVAEEAYVLSLTPTKR